MVIGKLIFVRSVYLKRLLPLIKMKIISLPDLNSWFKKITCDSCLTELEIDEGDLFCTYRDRSVGKFNIILVNDIVNYYCCCMECEARVLVEGVPKLIQQRVAEKYPPPIRIKKKWYQLLF